MDLEDWCNEREIGFYLEANSGMYINDYYIKQGPEALAKYVLGKGKKIDDLAKFKAESMNQYIHLQGEDLYRDDVNKVSFILRSYQDHLDSIKDFPNLVANTWGGKDEQALFGDLGVKGITKKHAIEVLLDHLHASKEETISFGDAKIDLSMFECCNYNVAMGNGGKQIKEAADYITKSEFPSLLCSDNRYENGLDGKPYVDNLEPTEKKYKDLVKEVVYHYKHSTFISDPYSYRLQQSYDLPKDMVSKGVNTWVVEENEVSKFQNWLQR